MLPTRRFDVSEVLCGQAELAERAGVTQPVIARLERGGGNPTCETLELVLHAAGHRLELRAVEQRSQRLTLDTPLGSIDLLVNPEGADRYEAMRERADVVDLDGVAVRVVSLDDLLSMKRAAGRPQDVADIDALLTVRRVQRSSP
jgi:transcriptional regulator with XRE-family HTH domain